MWWCYITPCWVSADSKFEQSGGEKQNQKTPPGPEHPSDRVFSKTPVHIQNELQVSPDPAHTWCFEDYDRPSCVVTATSTSVNVVLRIFLIRKRNLQHLCCASLPCFGVVHVYRLIYASLLCYQSLPEFRLTHHRDVDDNLCHFSKMAR